MYVRLVPYVYCLQQRILVFSNISFMQYLQTLLRTSTILTGTCAIYTSRFTVRNGLNISKYLLHCTVERRQMFTVSVVAELLFFQVRFLYKNAQAGIETTVHIMLKFQVNRSHLFPWKSSECKFWCDSGMKRMYKASTIAIGCLCLQSRHSTGCCSS